MKKIIDFLIMAAFATTLYLDCRDLAVVERGNGAFGGEILVPVLIFVAWILFNDYWHCRKEEEKNDTM